MTYNVAVQRGPMLAKISSLNFVLFILIGCHVQSLPPYPSRTTKQLPPTVSLGTPSHWEAIVDESTADRFNCPDDMVEIDGLYCPVEEQECLRWVDAAGNITEPPFNTSGRCGEWKNPVKCLIAAVHKHYCIDRYEFPNKKGAVPQDWMSWYDVKNACSAESKRLCTRSEWDFAAEGTNWHPYPYGDGFHRNKSICNFDNAAPGFDILKVADPKSEEAETLRGLLVPSGSKEECVSDWGVHDMAGNIDEWVVNERGTPYVSGLMGGHVFGVRNASRPMTDAHGPDFHWYETGGRCCKDSNE